MKISALLNPSPTPEPSDRRRSLRARRYTDEVSPNDDASDYFPEQSLHRKSKAKLSKDAPKFERGETVGVVNYPPYEMSDADLARHLKDFKIFPSSDIAAYPRHIPYSSDKKDFLTKTGRDSFEVFQYTFRVRGIDKEWTVMWDYNTGLVRITPFFKCLGYAKTVPAKAIGATPGLKDLCYSITGGALAAQGYWMPFEAAKALAANLCYDIRYALVPLFGRRFVDMCLRPDHPSYKRHSINADIIKRCQKEVEGWKNATAQASTEHSMTSFATPRPAISFAQTEDWSQRTLRARPAHDQAELVPAYDLTPLHRLPQPNFMLERFLSPRDHDRFSPSPSHSVGISSSATSSNVHGSPRAKRAFSDVDDQESLSTTSSHIPVSQKRHKQTTSIEDDTKAAYWLVQLSMDDGSKSARR